MSLGGENTMTGRHAGLVTLMVECSGQQIRRTTTTTWFFEFVVCCIRSCSPVVSANWRKIVDFTTFHRPEQTPTHLWWVITFSLLPAIDAVKCTFLIVQRRSMLIVRQEKHTPTLIARLITMFDDEMENDEDDFELGSNFLDPCASSSM